jgi:uncharacterized protein
MAMMLAHAGAIAQPAAPPMPPSPPPVGTFNCQGQAVLPLTGRVVDQANLLSPAEEGRLSDIASRLEMQTKHQFVVVTTSDLKGLDVADYTRCLGNAWGIGRKDVNDGVVFLVAPNERRTRIEVGNGLGQDLTDAEASDILQRDVIPKFRAGDFPAGIEAGARAIVAEIDG